MYPGYVFTCRTTCKNIPRVYFCMSYSRENIPWVVVSKDFNARIPCVYSRVSCDPQKHTLGILSRREGGKVLTVTSATRPKNHSTKIVQCVGFRTPKIHTFTLNNYGNDHIVHCHLQVKVVRN